MKSFKQFMLEWSDFDHSDKIKAHMASLGYAFLGVGVDKMAFEDKDGSVLLIIGHGKNGRKSNPAHKMFVAWAEYCTKNKSNPFLPKYTGWTTFELDGKTYMQIRMERLIPIKDKSLANMMDDLAQFIGEIYIDHDVNFARLKKEIYNNLGKEIQDNPERRYTFFIGNDRYNAINELAILLGKKEFFLFLDTIWEVCQLAQKNGYIMDLHFGNWMHRSSGHPVMVDPWVVESWRSSTKFFNTSDSGGSKPWRT